MTGTDATPAALSVKKPLRSRMLRGLLWAFVFLFVALIVALAGAYWTVSSESGSRALINALSRWSGGALQADDWSGRASDHFELKRLRLHFAAMDIDAERIVVDWHPSALRFKKLDFDAIRIGRLEVRQAPSSDPLTRPTSLRLPFSLRLASLEVSLFTLGERGSAEPRLVLKDIVASADSDRDSHRITTIAASLPAGHLTGKGQIKFDAPFALQAQAGFKGSLAEQAVTVEGQAVGTLAKLSVQLKATGEGVSGDASAGLRPFAAVPVDEARIALRGIDPAHFNPDAPHALLDVHANLKPRMSGESWRVSGPVEVLNRKSARIDQGGLPIERVSAQMAWGAGALQLDALQLNLAGQGRMQGKLAWQAVSKDPLGKIEADLVVHGVDPSRLHAQLKPMQIAGTITAKNARKGTSLEQDFRVDLASGQYRFLASGVQHNGMLALEQAALTAGKASLDAKGYWRWRGAPNVQAFNATGRVRHFDPHAFVQTAPLGDLNADFSVDGALLPTWRANLKLDIAPSQLAGYPLQGHAALLATPDRIQNADIALDVMQNHLKLKGAFGAADDRLQLLLDAPQLARLQAGLQGRLAAQGVVGGSLNDPFAALTAQADALVWEGATRVESVRAKLQLEQKSSGKIDAQLSLKGLSTQGDVAAPIVRDATASLAGRRDAHSLRIDAALLKDQTLSATAEGAWRPGEASAAGAWLGRLTQFVTQGPLALRLTSPADISLSPQRIALGAASLGSPNGSVELTTTEWTPLRTVAKGRMSGMQLGFAVDEYQRTVMRGKSLQLGAEWDVTLAERANGLVRVFREGGDFILQGDAPIALGLETLELNLAANEDRLALSALMSGKRVGALSFAGSALARREGRKLSLDPNAPLIGVGHVEMPAIDWIGPLLNQNLRTSGSVVGDFNVLGTVVKPVGAGRIVGNKLSVALADQGLRLREGQVELNFDAARVALTKFDFRAERSLPPPDSRLRVLKLPGAAGDKDEAGRISGAGGIELKDGQGLFSIKLEQVPILQRPDQWVLVSGTAAIVSGWDHMDLSAKLRADAGFVGVPKTSAPTLGDDVVVRGRQSKPPQRIKVNADIDFDFGNNFLIKAWGIDTWLDGQMHVQLAQGEQPRATGALRTRDGVFDAYGQKLVIDRGLINFAGPLDNPGLNVVAVRKGLAVEAGVEVTGLVKRPRVRLVSDPEVPESEKLSWILLGRASDAGTADAGLLVSAASAAFGGDGPGIAQRVAKGFGLDEVSLGQATDSSRVVQSRVASNTTGAGAGSANEQVLTLGKRLSSKAYLALEQNLVGTESVIKLSYDLTRYLSLILRGGTDNALDLHYEISFK